MLRRAIHILVIAAMILAAIPVHAEGNTVILPDNPACAFFDNTVFLSGLINYIVEEQNGILYIDGKGRSFKAILARDLLDDAMLKTIRDYYNDRTSSDGQMFDKLLEYKRSYFSALQEYYQKEFLYGNDDLDSENNLVVFGNYKEKIYGQDSETILFNLLREGPDGPSEETRISLTIPVKQAMTIYTITFIVEKGKMDNNVLSGMQQLLSDIQIKGLPKLAKKIKVLSDSSVIKRANAGIYPAPGLIKSSYTEIKNERQGYVITIPSTAVPYRQNSVVGTMDYKSWKIGLHQFFSVSVEPSFGNPRAIEDKIKLIKYYYGDKLKPTEESLKKINENYFYQFTYELTGGTGDITYHQEFFLVNGGRLYDLHFNSSDAPDDLLLKSFLNIVAAFSPKPGNAGQTQISSSSMKKYVDIKDSYSVSYPAGWRITRGSSKDQEFDSFELKNSALSGTVDILVAEGEFYFEADTAKEIRLLTGEDSEQSYNYFRKYSAPYYDKKSKLLSFSLQEKDGVKYLLKLVNYIDSNDRSKLCYSVDIIKGKSIYSLFIDVNDYAAENGNFINDKIYNALTSIASSFTLENSDAGRMEDIVSFIAGSMRLSWN